MKKIIFLSLILITAAIIAISVGVKNIISKRSATLVENADLKNEQSLLNLAENCAGKKDYLKAKEALKEFRARFPHSEGAGKAEKAIEEINIKILFSGTITDDSFAYEVQPGDALAKIASKFGTTVALIKKSNGLQTDLIIPGRLLKVNKAKFEIHVDKSDNILTLKKSDGEVVKTYVISTGENLSTPEGMFKIEEKLISPPWYKDGGVVEPGSPEYELGSRWMGLSASGYGIHGTRDASSLGKHITNGCVRMKNEDAEELYDIIPRGTKVIIVE